MPCPYASGFLSSPAPVPRRADRKRSECAPGLTDAGLRPVTPLASRSLRQPVHVPRPAAAAGVSGCHGCCGCSPRASRPRRAHSQPQLRRRADTAPRPAHPQPLPTAPVRSSSCHVPCGAGPAPAARAHAHSQGQPAAVRAAAPTAATVLARCLRHNPLLRKQKDRQPPSCLSFYIQPSFPACPQSVTPRATARAASSAYMQRSQASSILSMNPASTRMAGISVAHRTASSGRAFTPRSGS